MKKKKEKSFSECRKLLIKIGGSIQAEPQDQASIQTPEDSDRIYKTCDCCQRIDIPNEETVRIGSGQQLCPACLTAFYAASNNIIQLEKS